MKFKTMTYKEYKGKFNGLNRFKFERTSWQTSFGGLIKMEFKVDCSYSKKTDATYTMIAPLGYIDLFGVKDDAEVYLVKTEGKNLEPNKDDAEKWMPFFEDLKEKWETRVRES